MHPADAHLITEYLKRIAPRGFAEEMEVLRLLSVLKGLQNPVYNKEKMIEQVK